MVATLICAGATWGSAQTTYPTRNAFNNAWPEAAKLSLAGLVGTASYPVNWNFSNGRGYSTFSPISIPPFTFTGNTYGTLTETYLIEGADFCYHGKPMILGGRYGLLVDLPDHTDAFAADIGISASDTGNRSLTVLAKVGLNWRMVGTFACPDGNPVFLGFSANQPISEVQLLTNYSGLGGFIGMNNIATNQFATDLSIDASAEATDPSVLRINPNQPENLKLHGTGTWAIPVQIDIQGRPKPAGGENDVVKLYIESDQGYPAHILHSKDRPHGWVLSQLHLPAGAFGPGAKPGESNYSDQDHAIEITLDKEGKARRFYFPPEGSGVDTIKIFRDDDPSQIATAQVTCGFGGMVSMQGMPYIEFIGNTGTHPDNWNVTPEMQQALNKLALCYYRGTGMLLPLNDCSLPQGGLFDIFGDWGYHNNADGKAKSHIGHRLGVEADLGLTTGNDFMDWLLGHQGTWVNNPDLWKSEVTHYHINLAPTAGDFANSPAIAFYMNPRYTTISDPGGFSADLTVGCFGALPADAVTIKSVAIDPSSTPGTTIQVTPPAFGHMEVGDLGHIPVAISATAKRGLLRLNIVVTARNAKGNRIADQSLVVDIKFAP